MLQTISIKEALVCNNRNTYKNEVEPSGPFPDEWLLGVVLHMLHDHMTNMGAKAFETWDLSKKKRILVQSGCNRRPWVSGVRPIGQP